MPWHVVSEAASCPTSKPYGVVKDADGKVVGCHTTHAEARAQVAALYSSEKASPVPSSRPTFHQDEAEPEDDGAVAVLVKDFDPDQPRANDGKWSKTPGGGGTPGLDLDPIPVGGDLDKAVKLLTEGKAVELEQPDEVSTLLTKLDQRVKEAEAKGEKAPAIDLCKVTVPGTNLFCHDAIGLPRVEMPQLKGTPRPGSPASKMKKDPRGEVDLSQAFLDHLESKGVKFSRELAPSNHLKATQTQLNGNKVAGMVSFLKSPKGARGFDQGIGLFVSKDGYILDGHHRWAAETSLDLADNNPGDIEMQVQRADVGIGTLVWEALKFAREQGIDQAGLTKGLPGENPTWPQNGAEAKRYDPNQLRDPHTGQWIGTGGGSLPDAASFGDLSAADQDRWGESNEGSQAITAASAVELGLPGFGEGEPSARDTKIARAMLAAIQADKGSERPLYSGHNMSDERLAEFQEGKTVKLPLTATIADQNDARQFTTGEPGMRGGNDVLLKFATGTPNLNYGKTAGEIDPMGQERITAGEFMVDGVETTEDSYWGTKQTVFTLRSVESKRFDPNQPRDPHTGEWIGLPGVGDVAQALNTDDAIHRYEEGWSSLANAKLRGTKPRVEPRDAAQRDPALLDGMIKGMDEAIQTRGVEIKGPLYRGLDLGHVTPATRETIESGHGSFVDAGFVSTTGSRGVAESFAAGSIHPIEPVILQIEAAQGSKGLPVHVNDNEAEVVLPRGGTFEVTGTTTWDLPGTEYVDGQHHAIRIHRLVATVKWVPHA